ncbi:MAG: alpha/beta hydrolase family protein [Alphaproteobacteria bacterium]
MKNFAKFWVTILFGFSAGFWPLPSRAEEPNTPEIRLPDPSGEFSVGTEVFHWVDQSRDELWTADPGDRRELLVQLWYPTEDQLLEEAPYIPDYELLADSLTRYWQEEFPKVTVKAISGAGIDQSSGPFPVIILSHGMNASRWLHTILASELASRGFVVATIEHTFWGPGVAFPGGRLVSFEDGMIARTELTSNELDLMMAEGVVVFSEDQNFVAGKIQELNKNSLKYKGRLADKNIVVVGHSMGGRAADRSCRTYSVFSRCVSLDGTMWLAGQVGLTPGPSPKPFLLLMSAQFAERSAEMRTRYLSSWRSGIYAILTGSRHSSFTDTSVLVPGSRFADLALEVNRAVADIIEVFAGSPEGQVMDNSLELLKEMELVEIVDISETPEPSDKD